MHNLTWLVSRAFREHGTGKSRELAGWKACATGGRSAVAINCGKITVLHEARLALKYSPLIAL